MPDQAKPKLFIDLKKNIHPAFRWLVAIFLFPFECFLKVRWANRTYAAIAKQINAKKAADPNYSQDYWGEVLERMDVSFAISEEDFKKIPKEGPVLVVANHPFGGIDGIIMGNLLAKVRSDYKILGNYLLSYVEPIRPNLVEVDPFGGKDATVANVRPIKDSIRYLKEGHCLATFPAGEVSSLALRSNQVQDKPWSVMTARMARVTGATVLPVFFEGKNSALFYIAGIISPKLRTMFLLRELANKSGKTLNVKIGNPIPKSKIEAKEDDEALSSYLRLKTYLLKDREVRGFRRIFPKFKLVTRRSKPIVLQPVIDPVPVELLKADIEKITAARKLCEQGSMQVFFTPAEDIPNLLQEIGRLREVTFRAVGEGTGKSVDLDEYDDYYMHLILWDNKDECVVGSYRIGCVDEILRRFGTKGLYTSTLFKFKEDFFKEIPGGLEMGRSFIREEYQKRQAALFVLWRGIGSILMRYPRYRTLFGPVSISQDYDVVSRDLMVLFLKHHHVQEELAKKVKPKKAHKNLTLRRADREALISGVDEVDEISALVSEIETDKKGIPVLLRHYLKLNGDLISFNVDPAFQNSLDGLIRVDILKADPRILKVYFGSEKAVADYFAFHGKTPEFGKPEAK